METINPQSPLHEYCLGKLQQVLDLAMHTAEAASADGNHKIVLQAVREVTRIVTLMTKIEKSSAQQAATEIKAAPAPTTTSAKEARADVQELTSGAVQDVLKFFPGLTADPKTEAQEPQGKNLLFWKREKGRRSQRQASR
jgi:hypothetical protein